MYLGISTFKEMNNMHIHQAAQTTNVTGHWNVVLYLYETFVGRLYLSYSKASRGRRSNRSATSGEAWPAALLYRI